MDGAVVIIDTSEYERNKIKAVLGSINDFPVVEVPDKKSFALAMEKPDNIRLVVMDIALPDIRDGFEMLSELRTRSNVPVIITTRLDRVEYKAACLEYSVSDYIIKPYNNDRLKNSILSTVKIEKEFEYDLSGIVNVTLSFEDYVAKELKYSLRTKHPFSMTVIAPVENRPEAPASSSSGMTYQIITGKIKQALRSTDTVFLNTNGDMFILLPSTDAENARMVSDKLEDLLSTCLDLSGGHFKRHFSTAFVTFPGDGENLRDLLKSAFRKIESKKALEEMTSVLESARVKTTYGRYKLL